MRTGTHSTAINLIIWCFLLTGIVSCSPASQHNNPDKHKEPGKDADRFSPNELFFLDRNYPDFFIPGNLYQERLTEAIRYDETNPRSHRGFDHPWTVQGPGNIGGRINTIAVNPFDPNIILLGYSQGGIYQTKNGGMNWRAVFDDQPSLSISHISFDAQTAGKVFATTGDVNISSYPFVGSGVYQSNDGGATWIQKGLADKGVLSKVVVDPHNHSIVYVGSMGYPSHKGDERGFFRSTDGGESWNKTLTIDDSTGIIDIAVDVTQPGRVFATGWTRLRNNTNSRLEGPGTSVYRSDDFGETWINLVDGLPGEYHSRTGVEIANDGTLFVSYTGTIYEGDCAGSIELLKYVFRSIDGGFSWDTIVDASDPGGPDCGLLGGFGWYFEALKVNPENAQDLFILGVDMVRSLDGGQFWFEAAPPWWTYEVHADKHDLIFSNDKLFLATDGGAYSQPVDGLTPWIDIENIPSTQFYRTTFNPHVPDQYFGGAQDNGTSGGNEIIFNEWTRIFGGDGFQPLYDPQEPNWGYALIQNGEVWFTQDGFFYDRLVDSLKGSRYWDMPFVMSPHNSKILFAASDKVYKINMLDSAKYWKPISPDLTKGEFILQNRYPAITAIAQSGLDSLRLYAGTQDGNLWTSPDGGENWIDLSEKVLDQFVTSIQTSTVNPRGVFVTYSGYRDGDHTPYILKSDDAGENWVAVGSNIPMLAVNNLFILPDWNDEVLIAGSDGGVYVSVDGGGIWERLGSNFPYMPVYDVDYNPVMNTIIAATFSRGILTFPVEELDLVSSVEPIDNIVKMEIFPTLADDHITIKPLFYNRTANVQFDIVDLSGNLVKSFRQNVGEGEYVRLQVEMMPKGMYIVSVKSDNKLISAGKFLKI